MKIVRKKVEEYFHDRIDHLLYSGGKESCETIKTFTSLRKNGRINLEILPPEELITKKSE